MPGDAEERDAVQAVLVSASALTADDDFRLERVLSMLRSGKGEEDLVAWLSSECAVADAELVPLARAILKIGVRPRHRDWRRRRLGTEVCIICEREVPYCYSCKCGFRMCQDCMEENRWGITCNNITWECPDCGGMRSY